MRWGATASTGAHARERPLLRIPETGAPQRFVPAGTTVRATHLNGQPGFIAYVSGRPQAALIFDIRGDRIHTVYAIANPDNLRALPTEP